MPVAPVLHEVVELARERGVQRGITVTTELAQGLPPALIRPDDLQLVLGDLVGNAVSPTGGRGTVAVRGAMKQAGCASTSPTPVSASERTTSAGCSTSSSARSATTSEAFERATALRPARS